MKFQEFIKKYNDYEYIENPTNPNKNELKGQCVSMARSYMVEVLGIDLTNISGNAKDYWYQRNKNPLNNYFDSIEYHQDMELRMGDIFVLEPATNNPYGHIGICFGDYNNKQMHIFDSNYMNKKKCIERWRGYDGLLGVLRPKNYLYEKIK